MLYDHFKTSWVTTITNKPVAYVRVVKHQHFDSVHTIGSCNKYYALLGVLYFNVNKPKLTRVSYPL